MMFFELEQIYRT